MQLRSIGSKDRTTKLSILLGSNVYSWSVFLDGEISVGPQAIRATILYTRAWSPCFSLRLLEAYMHRRVIFYFLTAPTSMQGILEG